MGKIKVQKNVGGIEGLCVIEPKVFGDSRGYFVETYNKNDMLSEYEFDSGFRRSLDLVYFSKNIKSDYMGRYYLACSDDEKKIVDGWVESAYDFLENKAGITQEEIDSFMISLYPDGYYDYKAGKDYEDKYYKNYQER